jgi:hypothetical protein
MVTAISTGRAVTAMAVGRTEVVAVEVAVEAEEVVMEEAVVAMISAEVAVEVAAEAEEADVEEAVVAMVSAEEVVAVAVVAEEAVEVVVDEAVVAMLSPRHAGIRFETRDLLLNVSRKGLSNQSCCAF